MELGSLVVQRLATLANTFLAGAKTAEVLCRFRHNIIVQLENHTASWLSTDGNIKEHLWSTHG